jgi:hypothetical protein
MSRNLLHIWVVSLSLVPQFIVVSECEGFQGRSWTVQGEVIHHCMLGQIPQDDLVPEIPVNGIVQFDFFSLR